MTATRTDWTMNSSASRSTPKTTITSTTPLLKPKAARASSSSPWRVGRKSTNSSRRNSKKQDSDSVNVTTSSSPLQFLKKWTARAPSPSPSLQQQRQQQQRVVTPPPLLHLSSLDQTPMYSTSLLLPLENRHHHEGGEVQDEKTSSHSSLPPRHPQTASSDNNKKKNDPREEQPEDGRLKQGVAPQPQPSQTQVPQDLPPVHLVRTSSSGTNHSSGSRSRTANSVPPTSVPPLVVPAPNQEKSPQDHQDLLLPPPSSPSMAGSRTAPSSPSSYLHKKVQPSSSLPLVRSLSNLSIKNKKKQVKDKNSSRSKNPNKNKNNNDLLLSPTTPVVTKNTTTTWNRKKTCSGVKIHVLEYGTEAVNSAQNEIVVSYRQNNKDKNNGDGAEEKNLPSADIGQKQADPPQTTSEEDSAQQHQKNEQQSSSPLLLQDRNTPPSNQKAGNHLQQTISKFLKPKQSSDNKNNLNDEATLSNNTPPLQTEKTDKKRPETCPVVVSKVLPENVKNKKKSKGKREAKPMYEELSMVKIRFTEHGAEMSEYSVASTSTTDEYNDGDDDNHSHSCTESRSSGGTRMSSDSNSLGGCSGALESHLLEACLTKTSKKKKDKTTRNVVGAEKEEGKDGLLPEQEKSSKKQSRRKSRGKANRSNKAKSNDVPFGGVANTSATTILAVNGPDASLLSLETYYDSDDDDGHHTDEEISKYYDVPHDEEADGEIQRLLLFMKENGLGENSKKKKNKKNNNDITKKDSSCTLETDTESTTSSQASSVSSCASSSSSSSSDESFARIKKSVASSEKKKSVAPEPVPTCICISSAWSALTSICGGTSASAAKETPPLDQATTYPSTKNDDGDGGDENDEDIDIDDSKTSKRKWLCYHGYEEEDDVDKYIFGRWWQMLEKPIPAPPQEEEEQDEEGGDEEGEEDGSADDVPPTTCSNNRDQPEQEEPPILRDGDHEKSEAADNKEPMSFRSTTTGSSLVNGVRRFRPMSPSSPMPNNNKEEQDQQNGLLPSPPRAVVVSSF
ncbi:hypothetical protein ACA910_006430 [Epithemia clementina (nom. ined.)]